jgi:hypothetical protein
MTNAHLENLNEEVRQNAIEKEIREGKPEDRIHRSKEINDLYDMIRERIRQRERNLDLQKRLRHGLLSRRHRRGNPAVGTVPRRRTPPKDPSILLWSAAARKDWPF